MTSAELALKVREHVIRMARGGGCFLGASLSCTDILVHLYSKVLDIAPSRVDDPERDYLLLSKGHDCPALYGTLAELDYFPAARLARHLDPGDSLYWHPNREVPGVEFHSGSLGHLLSVSAGLALDIKRGGGTNRVFVVLGDGELNEGSVWEACLTAAALGLDNLVAVVDRNHFQANKATEELIPLEPLAPKFESFGWATTRINGHDWDQLDGAFAELPLAPGKPGVVIADTVRNKGLPSLEGKSDRWFVRLSAGEVEQLLAELHGGESVGLSSEPLVVR